MSDQFKRVLEVAIMDCIEDAMLRGFINSGPPSPPEILPGQVVYRDLGERPRTLHDGCRPLRYWIFQDTVLRAVAAAYSVRAKGKAEG